MADSDILNDAELLKRARALDRNAFQRLAEPHRAELQLHCYRMLGSLLDAEDLVQETYLRAWRGLARFEARTSFRRWLYRIATNACLNALASRKGYRRVLPDARGVSSDHMPGEPANDIAWLEPYPDVALEAIADAAPGPDARYELREAVQLAFIAAIQLLPPRQRAALLLRDVLGWSAAEVARLLDASVPSVNSALQRARAMMEKKPPALEPRAPAPSHEEQVLLERYLRSWEDADVNAFAAVLREDAVLTMPPWPQLYRGRDAISAFFSWTTRSGGRGPFRLVPTAANGQRAFAFYSRREGVEWRSHSVQLVSIQGESVAAMTSFVLPELVPAFGLPVILSEALSS